MHSFLFRWDAQAYRKEDACMAQAKPRINYYLQPPARHRQQSEDYHSQASL